LNGDGVIDPQTEMGRYSFSVTTAGTYQVREQGTAGYAQTAPAAGLRTDRVSVDNTGAQANRSSARPSISADGRFVAFESGATNLVPGDTNAATDVFVYDRQTGMIERVSVPDPSTGQAQANGPSQFAAISADGRFVAFVSQATNLVAGDTNGQPDVFVHDRITGATELVSVNSAGVEGNEPSGPVEFGRGPSISADGRFVAFESYSTNLVPGDNNGTMDVFVRDRLAGSTQRVSVNSAGQETAINQFSHSPSISADGRYVAFISVGSNLVPNDTNSVADIFVFDRQTGTTERVSTDSNGGQTNSTSANPEISADGRFVSFSSFASNLVAGDTNGASDVFVKDRQTGMIERVSVDSSGNQAAAGSGSFRSAISADGRFVAFESNAANLVAGDTNNGFDIFIRDRQTGQTQRYSVDSAGNQATAGAGIPSSTVPALSADGRTVAFQSSATNLVPDDTNNATDIFARGSGGSGSYLVTISPRQLVTGRDFGNAPTQSDVAVTVAGPADPVLAGTVIAYTLNYRNLGPLAAQGTLLEAVSKPRWEQVYSKFP
jgi:Tol biopolymer transport system component